MPIKAKPNNTIVAGSGTAVPLICTLSIRLLPEVLVAPSNVTRK